MQYPQPYMQNPLDAAYSQMNGYAMSHLQRQGYVVTPPSPSASQAPASPGAAQQPSAPSAGDIIPIPVTSKAQAENAPIDAVRTFIFINS